MANSGNLCPPPLEVQDFLFKQASVGQLTNEIPISPIGSSLIAADGKRGLLYIGHENELIIFKPGTDTNPEWKFQVDLPGRVYRVALSCDCSFLAVTCSGPSALIYDASSVHKHTLDLLHEIRLSTTDGEIYVTDLKWNPAIPDMLCTITSDHTIGCFQVTKDRKTGVQIIGMEKAQGLEALCVSWSPKGKQIVIGCKNGDVIQLKPELKLARHLTGPNPSEGIIISILWVSNYQFCTCYFNYNESRISVMIVDAPKGVTVPKFTNYEDITFGSGSMEYLCYHLEYVPEWGIIIAASSNSSEVAVLGTYDNGTTWNLWQLMDACTVQLPLDRKTKNENYPVGIAIDKSSVQKLPWGTDSTLPNPVPILRILVTSGQLCCYHMVNLKENAPALCSPPAEIIPAPQLRRPIAAPSDVSFHIQAGATSTPRAKQTVPENVPAPIEKSKSSTNMFGSSSGTSGFSFLAPANKTASDIVPPQTEIKTSGLFSHGNEKSGFFQQETKINKPQQSPQMELQFKQPPAVNLPQQSTIQQTSISSGFSSKPELKTTGVLPQVQRETKLAKEPAKETSQYPEEVKTKETPEYDESLCLQAYLQEQIKFEKELKNQLELPAWECGTEEERLLIVKKTEEINEFFKELRETTDSLASDVSYLKALLLQSFAWLEESKSKNSSNFSISGKSLNDNNKLAELQRLYYYTQSQLMQASKALDLQWAEQNKREISRMKIPSLEQIYHSLMRYNQIIIQEKKNIDDLSKKWRNIARGPSNVTTSLDRSMASLNISHNGSFSTNDAAIDLRCQHIAKNTKNFSKDKQMKLRDLLSESAPRIIRAARPTAVQDRLEATLLSLASSKTLQASNKTKTSKVTEQQKLDTTKSPVGVTKTKLHNPLSSLDNLVSGMPNITNSFPSLSKSPGSIAPFSTFSSKPPASAAEAAKTKENITLSFGQQPTAAYSISKPITKDSISFGSPSQKTSDPQIAAQAPFTEINIPKFSFTKSAPEVSITPVTSKSSGFSFSTTATPPSFTSAPKVDSASIFKFSAKTSPSQASGGGLDLSNLSFGTKSTQGATPAFSFGKSASPQQSLTSPSVSPASSNTSASVELFGKSSGSDKNSASPSSQATTSSPTAPTTTTSIFGTSTMFTALTTSANKGSSFNFTPVSTNAGASSGATPATTSSSIPSFGGFLVSTTSSSPSFGGIFNSTASLGFGTEIPKGTSVTPAFGKSTNIFGSATPVTSATAISPIFGGKSSINAKPTGPTSSPTTSSIVTTTASTSGDSDKVASTTTTTSIFGNVNSTSSAGEKTPTPASSSSETNIFGVKTPTATTASIFGGSNASTPTGSLFGSTSNSVFGGTSGTQSSNVFGASGGTSLFASSSTTPSAFGGTGSIFNTQATGTTTATTSVFGTTSTTGTSLFGGGTTATTTTPSPFGSSTASTTGASVFGSSTSPTTSNTSLFGSSSSPTTTASLFGGTASTTTVASVFGSGAGSTTTAPSMFGASATSTTSAPVFGAATTKPASVFGGTASTTTSLFGSAAATTTSATAFGNTTSTAGSSSIFGGSSVFGASPTASGSLFGSSAAATTASSTFGSSTAPATTSASVFGSPTSATSGSMFGSVTPQKPVGMFGASGGSSMFGGSAVLGSGNPVFGSTASPPTVFGQSAFGESPSFNTSPSSGFSAFGSPAAFGAAAPPTAFGSPSMMGSTSPSALGGTSPTNAFNSTFEALGSQTGGLSFGSLAQKTPEPKPQSFQGSSSFSSWR